MPCERIRSRIDDRPDGNRAVDGCQSPTLAHHPAVSSYQPASMQKTSLPTRAAASMSGRSLPSVGSPSSVFM